MAALGYTIAGVIDSISGSTVHYSGTYEFFYNVDGNDTRDLADLRVSQGTFALQAEFAPLINTAPLPVRSIRSWVRRCHRFRI